MSVELIPGAHYTIQELSELYNQTRVDYLVPMPMSADRLSEYIRDFDVKLSLSCVARLADGEVLGLSMLGLRNDLAWITRLGVLPTSRRMGTGSILMDAMIANARQVGASEIHLEVIKNNAPAHSLFLRKGFVETGQYLVMRRAPRPLNILVQPQVEWLERDQALDYLDTYPRHLTWINAPASMHNAPDVQGIHIESAAGSGWLVYRIHKFHVSHEVLHTESGNPVEVGRQLLASLHNRYPRHDTYAENIQASDPHLPAFFDLGYFQNFMRIEMRYRLAGQDA